MARPKRSSKSSTTTVGGEKLRDLIEVRKVVSQAQFAREAGVERVTLRRVMRGERSEFVPVGFATACMRAARKYGLELTCDDFNPPE